MAPRQELCAFSGSTRGEKGSSNLEKYTFKIRLGTPALTEHCLYTFCHLDRARPVRGVRFILYVHRGIFGVIVAASVADLHPGSTKKAEPHPKPQFPPF